MVQDTLATEEPSTSYPTDGPFRHHATCKGHTKAVSSVRFSPSGELLASVSADATLRLWRVPDGSSQEPPILDSAQAASSKARQQHTAGINDVTWNPSGTYLATASDDLTAKIWDAETQKCLLTLSRHTNYVFCCQFNPAGSILATGSFDETIRFWDVRTGRVLRELPAHSDPVTGLDYHCDGTVLASCSFDGLLRLWDTSTGHCLKTLAIDNGQHPLTCVHFTPNGQYMLLSALNSCMRLVSTEEGTVLKEYAGCSNQEFCAINTFIRTLPRQAVASGSEDGSIFVWDLNTKQVLQRIPNSKVGEEAGTGHTAAVLGVDAHPRLPLLASASHEPDCTVKLWSAGPLQ